MVGAEAAGRVSAHPGQAGGPLGQGFPGAGPGCYRVLQTIAAGPQAWRVAT